MCIIIDTNRFGDFLKEDDPDMKPVKKWLEGSGKLAYSPIEEFERSPRMWKELVRYDRIGKAKQIPKEDVEEKQKKLKDRKLKSNDPHIIALAQAANVKVLVSNDEKLHEDFKDIQDGKIYQEKKHEGLLRSVKCA